jgi:hypothetical protein
LTFSSFGKIPRYMDTILLDYRIIWMNSWRRVSLSGPLKDNGHIQDQDFGHSVYQNLEKKI